MRRVPGKTEGQELEGWDSGPRGGQDTWPSVRAGEMAAASGTAGSQITVGPQEGSGLVAPLSSMKGEARLAADSEGGRWVV